MLIIELMVDVQDAMGANIVIKMAETIAPDLEKITGGEIRARIVSNLAQNRLAYAQAVWRKNILGESLIESILDVYEFAKCDESRAVTHNKGIMNGICAVALATGNDTRALEAGAHGFAVKNGRYNPLTNYKKDKEGNLIGNIELPITVGTVGYSINNNPMAQICFKILGVKCAKEFACVLAAVGLAQNFAALRVLAGEGLLKGHKKLSSYKKRDKSGKSLESCSCLSA
jgi:hydroxymethylglutaryl-CoA reductase